MPKYLTKVDFTQRVVTNPLMLHEGGDVRMGIYVRTRRNMLKSPVLLRRIGDVAAKMIEHCRLDDACTTNPKLVGKKRKGKVLRACTPEEAARRIAAARECAMRVLPTAYPGGA